MKFVWGILLIGLGLLLIGGNQGWWNPLSLEVLWQYWPVILILIGVSILLRGYTWKWIVLVLLMLIVIGVLIDAVSIKPVLSWNKQIPNTDYSGKTFTSSIPVGVKKADMTVKTGLVELNLSGKSDQLITGEYGNGFVGFNLDINNSGSKSDINLVTDQDRRGAFPRWNNRKLDYKLSSEIIWNLRFDTGASKMTIDTRELIIENIDINTGATDLLVWTGEGTQNNSNIAISAGASNIQVKYPKSIGVDLKISSGLASRDFENFEKISNTNYRSQNYDLSTKKINLNIEAGLSSIQVSSY